MGGGGISAGMAGENPPRPGVAEDSVPKPRSFRLLAFNMPLRGGLWRPCGDANSPMKRPGLGPGTFYGQRAQSHAEGHVKLKMPA